MSQSLKNPLHYHHSLLFGSTTVSHLHLEVVTEPQPTKGNCPCCCITQNSPRGCFFLKLKIICQITFSDHPRCYCCPVVLSNKFLLITNQHQKNETKI